jgi:hypothetical protein
MATSEVSSVLAPELHTPLPYGLVGDENSALTEELLDIAETKGESVIQVNGVTDDLSRKRVARPAACVCCQPRSPDVTGAS